MKVEADGRRVALLARPGLARERLNTVLDEAGALCVLAADPTELDPAALIELGPQLVVVALDPITEEVLELFDAVLGDPSVDVIYEEAEQAASREGWDAARWQRHLVAKLQGHRNVLPPGSDSSPAMPADAGSDSGPATKPVASPDPHSPSAGVSMSIADTLVPAIAGMFDPVNAEVDGLDAVSDHGLSPESWLDVAAEAPTTASELSLSLESSQSDLLAHDEEPTGGHAPDALEDFDFSLELAGDDPGASAVALDDSGFAGFDPVNAETAAGTPDITIDLALALEDDNDVESAQGNAGTSVPRQELSLEDHGPDHEPRSRNDVPRPDLTSLHARISTLELVGDAPAESPVQPRERGAVLILSGLGGPDAVRQLLGALPQGFTRPVLVRQHLDGGRYDRLVTQLQRASALPVELAEPDQLAMPGTVYILPDAVGATSDEDGVRFCGDPGQSVLTALPSADSAVLLLSGSDPIHVEAAMAHGDGGALVAGQAADGCYDPAASNALAARGGDVASPAEIALRLSARWSNQGSSNVQA